MYHYREKGEEEDKAVLFPAFRFASRMSSELAISSSFESASSNLPNLSPRFRKQPKLWNACTLYASLGASIFATILVTVLAGQSFNDSFPSSSTLTGYDEVDLVQFMKTASPLAPEPSAVGGAVGGRYVAFGPQSAGHPSNVLVRHFICVFHHRYAFHRFRRLCHPPVIGAIFVGCSSTTVMELRFTEPPLRWLEDRYRIAPCHGIFLVRNLEARIIYWLISLQKLLFNW